MYSFIVFDTEMDNELFETVPAVFDGSKKLTREQMLEIVKTELALTNRSGTPHAWLFVIELIAELAGLDLTTMTPKNDADKRTQKHAYKDAKRRIMQGSRCPVCGKSTDCKMSLVTHIVEAHRNGVNELKILRNPPREYTAYTTDNAVRIVMHYETNTPAQPDLLPRFELAQTNPSQELLLKGINEVKMMFGQ